MGGLCMYVGPREIADRISQGSQGRKVENAGDVLVWIQEANQEPARDGTIIATFIVDEAGYLRIADRHSEHVACAGGQPVQSAGEIAFIVNADNVAVDWVTNQSTGYCPEPDSWPAVEAALRRAGMDDPDGFRPTFVFRRCTECGSINVVKENDFTCGVCSKPLPEKWNFVPTIEDGNWTEEEMVALEAQMFEQLDNPEEIE